ncbi:MAG: phytoene desaturase family protein [Roseococcus sp.]|nr:phytoene desaturase family protein [Roseococcus sp.]
MRVAVVGAGVGGLAAAADLARRGCEVTVFEAAEGPGGKMRQIHVAGRGVDAGPTVFTMRWIFEGLFADAGRRLEDHLEVVPSEILARHAWRAGGRLDLFADIDRSAEAIAAFASAEDARNYRAFCARSAAIYRTLAGPFIASERPSPLALVRRVGLGNLGRLWGTAPMATLWSALGAQFRDARLRQLFARYATYVGASPFLAPATLMLIAHVEQDGVWQLRGGMHALARALHALAEGQGARFRFAAPVAEILVENGRAAGVRLATGEMHRAEAVVFNGDASALGQGLLGPGARRAAPETPRARRSLSALTWCLNAPTEGFPLAHHNVFFAEDYAEEFDAIFRRRTLCAAPTVYVCAQDRGPAAKPPPPGGAERLLVLVNAPADGDAQALDLARHEAEAFALLAACGLHVARAPGRMVATTPEGFHALFPGTGGALYGRANHGMMGSFARLGAASRLPGLYLAGGSVHPGAGVPMAAMSGRLAAARLLEDRAGRRRPVLGLGLRPAPA